MRQGATLIRRLFGFGLETPWAPRMAQLTTLIVLSGYAFNALINVVTAGAGTIELLGFALCFSVVFVLQIVHTSRRPLQWPLRIRIMMLSLQAFATYLPVLWVGRLWGGMAGFLAGSILLVLGPVRWVLYLAVGVSVLVPSIVVGMSLVDISYITVSTLLTGLVVFAMGALSAHVIELHAARAELARMAVAQERLRVARDLHDLLGYGLSSITLRSELIYRLLPGNPVRAQEETAEVLDVARRALADVRLVARGYREMSLAKEVESAQSVLSAADIQTQVEISCGDMPRDLDTVMATVLREAVTNLLRHSKAQRCVIKAIEQGGAIRLQVSNDGVKARLASPDAGDSSGLDSLITRLEGIGGRLSTEVTQDGWFHLIAEAPRSPLCPLRGARHATSETGRVSSSRAAGQQHVQVAGRGQQLGRPGIRRRPPRHRELIGHMHKRVRLADACRRHARPARDQELGVRRAQRRFPAA